MSGARPARLDDAALQAALASLPGWEVVDGALQKNFRFDDFDAAMAFATRVADVARAEDHHPDMTVGWGRCMLRWSTHDAGGLTARDTRCAGLVDALARP